MVYVSSARQWFLFCLFIVVEVNIWTIAHYFSRMEIVQQNAYGIWGAMAYATPCIRSQL